MKSFLNKERYFMDNLIYEYNNPIDDRHPLIFINKYKSETFSTHLHITKGKRALLSSSKVSGKGKSDLFSINNHISSEEYKLKKK